MQHELTRRCPRIGGDDGSLHTELVRGAGLALADALHLRSVEGIQLPAALALLLRTDRIGAREWPGKCRLEVRVACDLAPDVANEPAKPGAQNAQLSAVAVELFGMGITRCHHGGALGDAHVRLPQPHAVLPGQPGQPLDRSVQKLRIGREGNVLGLHGGIDRDPRQILCPERPALVRHPQALGQQKFQLVTEALAPMAQVRALVRKLVLEELLSSEVLEVRVIDPPFAHAFVGQAVHMLEQKSPITNRVAIPGRPLFLYSGAISPSMKSQSILPASCTSSCLMLMIWSNRARNRSPDPVVSCFLGRIAPSDTATESCFSIRGNRENELQVSRAADPETLQSQLAKTARKRLSLSGLELLHGRLLNVAHWQRR